MEDKEIQKICRFARKFKLRRGEAIICLKDMSEKDLLVFVNFPDRIATAPNCVATTAFSTGHATPDCRIEKSKMYDCSRRKEEKDAG
jgi:hypothetical protein